MRAFVALLLLALPLAGCFGEDAVSPTRTISASGGRITEGWAYDGSGISDAAGTMSGTLDNAANAGNVTVSFTFHGAPYVVSFASFAATRPFQDGGIAFDLPEHGATGNGDALLPQLQARIAAWGQATVLRDGVVLGGVNGTAWTAHLMVSDDTVRGTDGKISNAAGGAYDPAKPTDARVVTGDPQVLFFIKSPDGETARRESTMASHQLTCGGTCREQITIDAKDGAEGAEVVVNLSGQGGTPLALGQFVVSVADADGNDLGSQTIQATPNAPGSATFSIPGDAIKGPLTVVVSGNGTAQVNVDSTVLYDDHPFLVLTFDEVTVS